MHRRTAAIAAAITFLVGGAATATAADLITSADIQNGAVKSADVKNGAIKRSDLSAKIRAALDAPGPQGPAGPQGVAGPQGPAGQSGPALRVATKLIETVDSIDQTVVAIEVPAGRYLAQAKAEMDNALGPQEADCDLRVDGTLVDRSIAGLTGDGGNTVTLLAPLTLDAPAVVSITCSGDNVANDPIVARHTKLVISEAREIIAP